MLFYAQVSGMSIKLGYLMHKILVTYANWQAGYLYIQMLRSVKPGLRPDLRNRLVGDIPNPRMIANFVVRLSVVSLR